MLERFQEHGLKLKPSKCNFFQTEISYIGHQVSAAGTRPGINNVQGIAKMAPPMTFTGIQHYLGATGFYRRFIKGYAQIAKPLQDLISDDNSKLKKETVLLTPEAIEAFQQLKVKCMTAPVLAFADFTKPFLLEIDASGDGLGAVLQQKQDDGKYHPVAFASRALKGDEKRYHSSKLEFLALKWAVTEQFRESLLYQPFKVRMDNNPLTYIMTTLNLDTLGHRWVSALADFQMSIEYVQGADNKVADALSHVKDWLPPEAVKELIDFAQNNTPIERAEVNNPTLIAEEEALDHEVVIQSRVLMAKRQVPKQVSTEYWIKLQKQDAIISHVRGWMLRSPANKRTLSQYLLGKVLDDIRQAYARHQQDLVMSHNLLYMKATAHNARDVTLVFVVLAIKRQAAIDGCHHNSGHQGQAHTLSLLRERFWWPRMQVETMMAVKNCGRCRLFEGQDQQPELYTVEASEPLDLVHIDFVSMETTMPTMKKPIVQKVLVVIDHFTRYVQAYPVDNEQAETVADILYNKYFCTFEFPCRLMSNQAKFLGSYVNSCRWRN